MEIDGVSIDKVIEYLKKEKEKGSTHCKAKDFYTYRPVSREEIIRQDIEDLERELEEINKHK